MNPWGIALSLQCCLMVPTVKLCTLLTHADMLNLKSVTLGSTSVPTLPCKRGWPCFRNGRGGGVKLYPANQTWLGRRCSLRHFNFSRAHDHANSVHLLKLKWDGENRWQP